LPASHIGAGIGALVGVWLIPAEVGAGKFEGVVPVGIWKGVVELVSVGATVGQEPRQKIVGVTKTGVGVAVRGEPGVGRPEGGIVSIGASVFKGGGVTEPPKLMRTVPAGSPLMLSELVAGSYVQFVSGVPLTETAVGCLVVYIFALDD
jgi:hypothetical protein